MTKIWIDVSNIISWTGTFTGIQRVVYSYATRMLNDKNIDTRLFQFNGHTFEEVSVSAFMLKLTKNVEIVLSSDNGSTMGFKKLIQKGLARGMPVLKARVGTVPYIGDVSRVAYRKVRSVYRIARYRDPNVSSSKAYCTNLFSKGDVVLLIDGHWGDGNTFARSLAANRKETGFKIAHLVNDIVAVKNPAYVAKKADQIIGSYFETILPHVDTLVAISKATLDDVQWFCKQVGINLTKDASVIRIGDELESPGHKKTKQEKPRLATRSKFLLTVGTLEVRKNHHLLYYVYKLAHEKGIQLPTLVIAGRKGWMSEETIALFKNDSDVKNNIEMINPTDGELAWLYSNCLFTVFPTFYEGWGIPVVESLANGKICLASNTSSIPEVAGQLVEYASPYDTAEWLRRILKLSNPAHLKRAEKEVAKHFKLFSWDDSARQLTLRLMQASDNEKK